MRCNCIYHVDCLDTKVTCIAHKSSQLVKVTRSKCIVGGCSSSTTDGICRQSLLEIETRTCKFANSAGGSIEVSKLFVAIFSVKTLWTESVNDVSCEAVAPDGRFKQRQHPVVAFAWPIIWRHLCSSFELVIVEGVVWLTFAWIESQLSKGLPRFIPYSEIVDLVEHIQPGHVAAFKTAVTLGKCRRFCGTSSTGINIITPLGCYDYKRTIEAVDKADFQGLRLSELMKEHPQMNHFIQRMKIEKRIVISQRKVYSLRYVERCDNFEVFQAIWDKASS